MGKLILTSVLFATVLVPAWASRDPDGRRGLRRMLVTLLAFDALYVALLVLVYGPLFPPEIW